MNVQPTELPEVLLIEPRVFHDARGYFLETWRAGPYAEELGLPPAASFVQDNLSWSRPRVLRGLHYQHPNAQGKLVMALVGAIHDVAVDLRRGSPRFKRWTSRRLTGENHHQLYIPPGFAHGFQVLGDEALVCYKCTGPYSPADEHTLAWDDPEVGVSWPLIEPILNAKDRDAPTLENTPARWLFD
jgi:dTDP-4-dehydrorhamnose 3,5-epimerase